MRKIKLLHHFAMMSEAFTYLAPKNPSKRVILCDHAANFVPPWVNDGDLGISEEDMNRHIAYDVGALEVSKRLAKKLDAHLVHSNFSRLVIDPNRGEDDPTLIMRFYDKSIIPANLHISKSEREMRIENLHRPYHEAIKNLVCEISNPVIISIHSFTKQLKNRPPRPWHVGVLYGDDARLSTQVLKGFSKIPEICVGDNEPYHGALTGDTLDSHGIKNGTHHTLIEIRNDLICDSEGQNKWADICAQVLEEALTREGIFS